MTYEECAERSLAFFADGVPDDLPDVAGPIYPPCPICDMDLMMADIPSGELGWECHVCGICWCKSGCHGQESEDHEAVRVYGLL